METTTYDEDGNSTNGTYWTRTALPLGPRAHRLQKRLDRALRNNGNVKSIHKRHTMRGSQRA